VLPPKEWTRELLEDVLKHPAKKRGRIIHELIRSWDANASEDPLAVEETWAHEVNVRLERA
jgi:hypothetical protein